MSLFLEVHTGGEKKKKNRNKWEWPSGNERRQAFLGCLPGLPQHLPRSARVFVYVVLKEIDWRRLVLQRPARPWRALAIPAVPVDDTVTHERVTLILRKGGYGALSHLALEEQTTQLVSAFSSAERKSQEVSASVSRQLALTSLLVGCFSGVS